MRLELEDVFFHELTKHNVDADFDYIGSDIESDLIDPEIADHLNDEVFNEERENQIKESLSKIPPLLENALLWLLVLKGQSGFLKELQNICELQLKLPLLEFLGVSYLNNSGIFIIDKNKTRENCYGNL